MSIVERAIKRLQVGGHPAPRQVFGQVVESANPPAESSGSALPGFPVRVVSINQGALRAAGLLAPVHQERQIANQYRQIKRPLIANALGRGKARLKDGQLIMVASAMPGEGKTFTAINLAFSMALEKDVQVLLVDADVAKPQVSKMFGVAGEPGLMDMLSDPAVDVERHILHTDVPQLSLLPAGLRSDFSTELIASERMTAIMRELVSRDSSRVVVFDSPPLLLTTESQALAHVAGQIVVVVRADYTEQRTVMDALSHLPEEAPISMVLNQSAATKSSSYYYGYGAVETTSEPQG